MFFDLFGRPGQPRRFREIRNLVIVCWFSKACIHVFARIVNNGEDVADARLCVGRGVTELPSTPKIKQQSSITNPHSETVHFYIKSMPICGKFGAASTAGWGAGAAIFSPVGRVVPP